MADFGKLKEEIINCVELLDEENVLRLAEQALKDGMEQLALLNIINVGMARVGRLYESKDYFIADLIMAGIIFKEVLELDKMTEHFHSSKSKRNGKIIIGTVKGDIHDIGKDIFRGMMETNGFEVIDLGVDVPKELFIKKFMEHKPEIVGLSGVLTLTVEEMKEVVAAFVEAGLRNEVKIIIGGDHLTKDACIYIGADHFANDAMVGVQICQELVKNIKKQGATENGSSGLS
ncbi:MAG: cobalamin-dependent protein [Clostridia bacterium]|jgi:methanogenic corrinoid protein MtbC1|nr:cobalamin-dependent protein [Clostridia bacterium]